MQGDVDDDWKVRIGDTLKTQPKAYRDRLKDFDSLVSNNVLNPEAALFDTKPGKPTWFWIDRRLPEKRALPELRIGLMILSSWLGWLKRPVGFKPTNRLYKEFGMQDKFACISDIQQNRTVKMYFNGKHAVDQIASKEEKDILQEQDSDTVDGADGEHADNYGSFTAGRATGRGTGHRRRRGQGKTPATRRKSPLKKGLSYFKYIQLLYPMYSAYPL